MYVISWKFETREIILLIMCLQRRQKKNIYTYIEREREITFRMKFRIYLRIYEFRNI